MIAPPAMVEIAEAICEPPCCSLIASPSDTAPQTTRNPPRKVTQPDTRPMMFASMFTSFASRIAACARLWNRRIGGGDRIFSARMLRHPFASRLRLPLCAWNHRGALRGGLFPPQPISQKPMASPSLLARYCLKSKTPFFFAFSRRARRGCESSGYFLSL